MAKPELTRVWLIAGPAPALYPVMFAEEGVQVQEKVVPGTLEVRMIEVLVLLHCCSIVAC